MEQNPKHIKDISEVKKGDGGIFIEIQSSEKGVESAVQTMVDNCSTGKCNCMTSETKSKVQGMEFGKFGGKSAIFIKGNLSVEEIKETMNRSTVDVCCSVEPADAAQS